ncbi:MAG: MATE family efflux transporter [Bacteroidales bacterium]|nr:MATE family efflux transporter [Candidatus Physcocola equi]
MSVGKSPEELGHLPVRKLLINYSLPTIFAQVAASVYNIIDSVFVGNEVGALGLSAMAVTLPLMNIAAAFGAMIGAGGSTLISIKMGQKDDVGAANVLGNVTVMNIILGLTLMTIGLLFMNPILTVFGASDQVRPLAADFMRIILLGNVVTHLYLGLNNAMRSSGNPQKAMNMTLMTVGVNLVLAFLFIKVFKWGLSGAALATVLAQLSALIIILKHFANQNEYLHFKRSAMKLKRNIVKGILGIGISPFLMHTCSCLVVILINRSLQDLGGDYAIGAYGNVNKILMFFAMVVLGINQGMQPIAGYNYGARQYDRVIEVLKNAICFASAVMIASWILCELFPSQIMSAFVKDDEKMVEMSAFGLKIAVITFPVVGFQMVATTFFQSIGKALWAAIQSVMRQMLFLVPLVLILPQFFGLTGLWAALPASDALSALSTAILLIIQLKKFKKMKQETKI